MRCQGSVAYGLLGRNLGTMTSQSCTGRATDSQLCGDRSGTGPGVSPTPVSAALHAGGNQAAGLLDETLFQVSTRAILNCQLELYGKREFEGLAKISKRAISKSCGPARLSGTATELQPTRVTAFRWASGANPIRKTSSNIQRPDMAPQGHAALARSSTRSTLSMRSRGGGSWLPNCPSFQAYLMSVLESVLRQLHTLRIVLQRDPCRGGNGANRRSKIHLPWCRAPVPE